MNEYIVDVAILAALILCSAYFSATETAFTSFNKAKLKNLAAKGSRRAELALRLSEDYDRLLSTILIGNNIVNISAAAFATVLFTRLWGNLGPTIATVVITLVVLIFGEITPKSIAKDIPEKFVLFSAPLIHALCVALQPVNYLFRCWKKLLDKFFKIEGIQSNTEEEILLMVEEARQEGGINEQAGELIRSAVEFKDRNALDICTPRTALVAVEESAAPAEIKHIFREQAFSRLPVYRKSIDDIVGVINQKDFYTQVLEGGKTIADITTPAIYASGTTRISALMRLMQQKHAHIAIIIDGYGGTLGLVTLEDILEELIGEIWDEHDQVVHEIEELSPTEYRVIGSANLERVWEKLQVSDDCEATSMNGWILHLFEKIPRVGDTMNFQNLTFEILEATDRKVLAVKIIVHSPQEGE